MTDKAEQPSVKVTEEVEKKKDEKVVEKPEKVENGEVQEVEDEDDSKDKAENGDEKPAEENGKESEEKPAAKRKSAAADATDGDTVEGATPEKKAKLGEKKVSQDTKADAEVEA